MIPYLPHQGFDMPFLSLPDLGPISLNHTEGVSHKQVGGDQGTIAGVQVIEEMYLEQTCLPIEGGRQVIRLLNRPRIEIDSHTATLNVVGWGVNAHFHNVEDLPRRMAKRFLSLFARADRKILSPEESLAFLHISEQVDYRQFSFDRSPPHYVEGKLIRKSPLCIIEWHDGESRRLAANLINELSVLDPGDEFSAYAKLGKDNEILSLERVLPMTPA